MATPNAAETTRRLNAFATTYGTATVEIKAGATVLASYSVTGWAAPSGSSVTSDAISNVVNANTGTADNATLSNGTQEYTLTVGLSGSDINIDNLSYVAGETSSLNPITVSV